MRPVPPALVNETHLPFQLDSKWILEQRTKRNEVSEEEPYAYFIEKEFVPEQKLAKIVTIFLTNRECPFRCLMCDLWKNTLDHPVQAGSIAQQIDFALSRLPSSCSQIKLYNSGSFFDPRAIPIMDYGSIAERLKPFSRVIVESHPAFLGTAVIDFKGLIESRILQVAIGLETAHSQVLKLLNKGMTLDSFASGAEFLLENGIELRAFLLLKPPFMEELEALDWTCRSIDFAFDKGASVISIIPTRGGNGAMEKLAELGKFSPPKLSSLEQALEYGVGLKRGIVLADLWDLEKFKACDHCFTVRKDRLEKMNMTQKVLPAIKCSFCLAD